MITSKKSSSLEPDFNTSHIFHTIDGKVPEVKEITEKDFVIPDIEIPNVIYEEKDRLLYIGDYECEGVKVNLNRIMRKRARLFSNDHYEDSPIITGESINYINSLLSSHPKRITIDYPVIEDLTFHKIEFGLEIKNLTNVYENFGLYPTVELTDSEIPLLIIDRCIGLHLHIENCKIGKLIFRDKDTRVSFNMFDSEVDEIDFTDGYVEFIRTRVDNSIIKKFIFEPAYNQGEVLSRHRNSIWRVGTYSDVESLNIDNLEIIKCNCRIHCK